jgi:hypothetical protein
MTTRFSKHLLLSNDEACAAWRRLASPWREWAAWCNDFCLQPALREVARIQRDDEIGVSRFSALAEWCVISIGQVSPSTVALGSNVGDPLVGSEDTA